MLVLKQENIQSQDCCHSKLENLLQTVEQFWSFRWKIKKSCPKESSFEIKKVQKEREVYVKLLFLLLFMSLQT